MEARVKAGMQAGMVASVARDGKGNLVTCAGGWCSRGRGRGRGLASCLRCPGAGRLTRMGRWFREAEALSTEETQSC